LPLFFSELIEEEEAFHSYHEHRSATLGRRPMSLTGGTSTSKIAETVLVAGLEDDDEYFERIRGIKNNFSRLVCNKNILFQFWLG
jgi:hypothetical protein